MSSPRASCRGTSAPALGAGAPLPSPSLPGEARASSDGVSVATSSGSRRAFSRAPRVLEHPVRSHLVQLVQTEPGIHRAEIARRLELAAGQTIHHLRVLVQQNVLSEVQNGWSKHYVVWGKYSPQTARQIVALRKDQFSTLLDVARANPGVSLQRLAQLANQSKSHTSKSVKALERVGLVRVERNGRWIRIYTNASTAN